MSGETEPGGSADRIEPAVAGERFDPRSVQAIARKDFHDAIRSRGLILLSLVFVVLFAASAFFFADRVTDAIQQQAAQEGQQVEITSDTYLRALTEITRLLVPLVGIVVAYASIVGERESGTMKLLLALPHSRLDVLLGKFAGRSAVLAVPVLLGFAVAAPTFPLADVPFEAVNYLGFAALTVLLGVVFVALALGASAAARTSRRAVIGTVGTYALFTLLWGQISQSIVRVLSNRTELLDQPAAYVKTLLVTRYLNPIAAYQSLTASLGADAMQARMTVFGLQGQLFAEQLDGLPFYLTDGALVVYLLLWIAVPLVLGYLVFEGEDL